MAQWMYIVTNNPEVVGLTSRRCSERAKKAFTETQRLPFSLQYLKNHVKVLITVVVVVYFDFKLRKGVRLLKEEINNEM